MHLLQRLSPHYLHNTCSVLCISCKDWVHTTCTTLTNTKQYTNAWTWANCNAQATPLVLSTANITQARPIITPHPTMQDNSTPNSTTTYSTILTHLNTNINRAPRSTQTTQQTCTPPRTPANIHTDTPQVHLLRSNQSPPPTRSLTNPHTLHTANTGTSDSFSRLTSTAPSPKQFPAPLSQ